MKKRDLVEVQLELFFGFKFQKMIQRLVDEALDRGEWADGYELAVSPDVIDGTDARKLLDIVLGQFPDARIEQDLLLRTIREKLPQHGGEAVSWIVNETGAFAVTDCLRVARFDGNEMKWCTERISYDGIEFDSLIGERLQGRAWFLSSDISPDVPFEIDFETGELIKGEVVP